MDRSARQVLLSYGLKMPASDVVRSSGSTGGGDSQREASGFFQTLVQSSDRRWIGRCPSRKLCGRCRASHKYSSEPEGRTLKSYFSGTRSGPLTWVCLFAGLLLSLVREGAPLRLPPDPPQPRILPPGRPGDSPPPPLVVLLQPS